MFGRIRLPRIPTISSLLVSERTSNPLPVQNIAQNLPLARTFGGFGVRNMVSGATGGSGTMPIIGQLANAIFGNQRSFDPATMMGVNDEQIAARTPQVDAMNTFYQLAYGNPLSERGIMEADYFVRTGRLFEGGTEFDNEMDFDRANRFLVQQREDALARSQQATMFGGGGFRDRVSSFSTQYNGQNVMGV
jgi:hypothetical protein